MQHKLQWARAQREQQQPTVPSTMKVSRAELACRASHLCRVLEDGKRQSKAQLGSALMLVAVIAAGGAGIQSLFEVPATSSAGSCWREQSRQGPCCTETAQRHVWWPLSCSLWAHCEYRQCCRSPCKNGRYQALIETTPLALPLCKDRVVGLQFCTQLPSVSDRCKEFVDSREPHFRFQWCID